MYRLIGVGVSLVVLLIVFIVKKSRGERMWDDAYYENKKKIDGVGLIILSFFLSILASLCTLLSSEAEMFLYFSVIGWIGALACLVIGIVKLVRYKKENK